MMVSHVQVRISLVPMPYLVYQCNIEELRVQGLDAGLGTFYYCMTKYWCDHVDFC